MGGRLLYQVNERYNPYQFADSSRLYGSALNGSIRIEMIIIQNMHSR